MEREKEFRAIFEGVLDAVAILDDLGRILDANPAACLFLGQPRSNVLGRSIFDSVDPGRRPALHGLWESFLRSGEQRSQFRLETPDGHSREIQLVARANFVPGRHLAVWRENITPLAVREVPDAGQRFERAFGDNPVPMTMTSLSDGRILEVNAAFLRFTGYRREELVKSLETSAGYWADPEERRRMIQRVATEEPVLRAPAQICAKSGDRLDVSVSVEFLPVDGETFILTLFHEETERKRAEQALQRAELEYRNLFETQYDSILIFDAETLEIVRANKRAAATYGIPDSALVGTKVTHLVVDVPKMEEQIRDTLAHGGLENVESLHYRSDGIPIDMLVSTSVVDYRGRVAILSINRDVSEKKRTEEQIRRLAFFDPLTALPNRTLFEDRVGRALSRAKRESYRLALLFLDLDRFKDVNDTFGHRVGDELLRQVGSRLTHLVRDDDTVARLGGDEFVVLLSEIGRPEDAGRVAENVLRSFREEFVLAEHILKIETSLGISVYPEDGSEAETLVKGADAAMYRAKQAGRNTYRYASALHAETAGEGV
jgi:diguanylate cyclase (GGDEF)-like protein/PAS domain S-box-containing protein